MKTFVSRFSFPSLSPTNFSLEMHRTQINSMTMSSKHFFNGSQFLERGNCWIEVSFYFVLFFYLINLQTQYTYGKNKVNQQNEKRKIVTLQHTIYLQYNVIVHTTSQNMNTINIVYLVKQNKENTSSLHVK